MAGWPTTDPLEYLDELPDPESPWHPTISAFSLTFDGYAARQGRESLPDFGTRVYEHWLAAQSLPADVKALDEIEYIGALRELLHWEQRVQWHREDGGGASEPTLERRRFASLLLIELQRTRDVFWARPTQKRAHLALSARLRKLRGDVLDGDSRTSVLSDALVPTALGAELDASLKDVFGGSGGELKAKSGRRPKLHSAYSSCGFAVNLFCPWRLHPDDLILGNHTGFTSLAFEVKCRIFPKGTPPNLDLVLRAPGRTVGVESKLTEYLTDRHEAVFDAKYDAVIGVLHPAWQELYQSLKANPRRFRLLNAAQLVKHALGLKRHAGEEPVTLSYLWWEPTNASLVPAIVQHRAEVAEFATCVAAAPDVVFAGIPAPTMWDEWIGHPDPAVRAHGEALAARYRLAI